MKFALGVILVAGAGLFAGQASADGLYLTADYHSASTANVASVAISGDDNALFVSQNFDHAGGANSLSIDIAGTLNGGPTEAAFRGLPAAVALVPGQLLQSGHNNMMSITLTGSQNLFAVSQMGSYNGVTSTVTGNYNQAIVSQTGSGNNLSFVQNGNGNRLTVVQRS